jgi:hypothetical protein
MQTTRPRLDGDRNGSARRTTVSLPPSRRRRVPLAIGAALVAVACALLFALLYRSAGQQELALVMGRDVPAGRVITADDLVTQRLSSEGGIAFFPAASPAAVIGKAAAVDLVAGTLLSPRQVGRPRTLAPGEAVVSLSLPDGETPTVAVGDHVQLVMTAGPGQAADVGRGEVITDARVVEVAPDGSGKVAVSVAVGDDVAAQVASAAAANRVRLVRVAGS